MRVNHSGRVRLRAHFASPDGMVVMHVVASNIFRGPVIHCWRYFLSYQFCQWRLTGIMTYQLNSIPEDGEVAPLGIAEISSVNFEGREWIGARQLHTAARERSHIRHWQQKFPTICRVGE